MNVYTERESERKNERDERKKREYLIKSEERDFNALMTTTPYRISLH